MMIKIIAFDETCEDERDRHGDMIWARIDIWGQAKSCYDRAKVIYLTRRSTKDSFAWKGQRAKPPSQAYDIKNQIADLGPPVNDSQMVDRMFRRLPALTCYDELRRKVFFRSNLTQYTPDLLREMIITAESSSEDWEGNTFDYKDRNRTQDTHGGFIQGGTQPRPAVTKKAPKTRSDNWYEYDGDHFKRDCMDLNGKKNTRKNYARSGRSSLLEQEVTASRDDGGKGAQKS